MKNRDIYWRRYKIQEALYLTQFSQSPSAASSYFPESHQWSEIPPLLKVILVLGKARSHTVLNLGYRGAESPGWFDVSSNNTTGDMKHDAWAGISLCLSFPSPVARSCRLLNHLNSFCRRIFKPKAKFYADSLLYLLSDFACGGHRAQMLTQRPLAPPLTSTVKLSLFTYVHSSPLPLAARLHWCKPFLM